MPTVFQSFNKYELILLKSNFETDTDLFQAAFDIFG
jgi:hypothetical protein